MKEKDVLFLNKLGFVYSDGFYVKQYSNGKNLSVNAHTSIVSFKSRYIRKLNIDLLKDLMILSYIDKAYQEDRKKIQVDKVYEIEEEKHCLDIKDGDKAIIIIPTKDMDEFFESIRRFMYNEFPLFECLRNDDIKTVSFLNVVYSKKEDRIVFNEQILSIPQLSENYKINNSTYKDPLYFFNELVKQQEKMVNKINNLRIFAFKLGNQFKGYKRIKFEFINNNLIISDNEYGAEEVVITSNAKIDSIRARIADLYVQEWNKMYSCEVPYSDYKEWKLTLLFNDSEKMIYQGINSYPKNWDKLVELIQEFSPMFVEDLDDEEII